ncbi:hypothetical protein B484DRAFT_458618 [Ochromonadaceae sp. CCMP2298]|nr:hypothetical protein B484DRAFT_458618 [Ochromonadaceae sp. CCMP2298]
MLNVKIVRIYTQADAYTQYSYRLYTIAFSHTCQPPPIAHTAHTSTTSKPPTAPYPPTSNCYY